MIAKTHKTHEGRTIVALCDEDILGGEFIDGNIVVNTDADFYRGEKVTDSEATSMLRRADIGNVVGKNAVSLAEKMGLVDASNVMKVKDVPFAQFVVVKEE